HLAAANPEVRRECLQFVRQHADLPPEAQASVDADEAWTLWDELEPDLEELDAYGGGEDAVVDRVGELLYQLQQKLEERTSPRNLRRELLDEVVEYIRRGNA